MKTLEQLAWNVDEKTYRADKALSYSTIARFAKEGFHKLDSLFEPISTSSTVFGSIVDTLITGTQEEFENNFLISNLTLDDDTATIVRNIYDNLKDQYKHFLQIPIIQVSQMAKQLGFWPAEKWSDNARYNGLIKKGNVIEYYNFLHESNGKTVITTEQYQDAIKCVQALKTSEATRFYFAENERNHPIQRYYQLKFKFTRNGVEYRSMIDECVVDYNNKKIYPIDLKTSSKYEDEFCQSFIQFNYSIQARLYYENLLDNILRDDYFKNFEIEDYTFIVINKYSLTPLTWRYSDTKKHGTLYYGKNNQIECKDPFEIGEELNYYLTNQCKVPTGIKLDRTNDLVKYLNEIQ